MHVYRLQEKLSIYIHINLHVIYVFVYIYIWTHTLQKNVSNGLVTEEGSSSIILSINRCTMRTYGGSSTLLATRIQNWIGLLEFNFSTKLWVLINWQKTDIIYKFWKSTLRTAINLTKWQWQQHKDVQVIHSQESFPAKWHQGWAARAKWLRGTWQREEHITLSFL
jgi:hypothetical protein